MTDFRVPPHKFLNAVLKVPEADLAAFVAAHVTPGSVWSISHPINDLTGPEEITEGFFLPLRRAFAHVYRREEIFMGGTNRRAQGGQWVSSITHYVGNFHGAFLGLSPSTHLAFLRSGEFYRVEAGRISEAKIIIDLPDLMRQSGRMPIPKLLGTEILFPSPATHDGVLPEDNGQGERSLDIVERMIGALHQFDPKTFDSTDQTGEDGVWDENMMWYGPAGIGSNFRWEGFVQDHRESFLRAFPDRKGGNHFCRIGNGNYASFSGWPSITMTHLGDYLGVPATGRAMTMRVMDFYRCANGRIAENWVCLDYMHLFHQMGIDLIARSEALTA